MTIRELKRATMLTAGGVAVAIVGYWLSEYHANLLDTWRFVNATIVLFVLILILWKWEAVHLELKTHLRDVLGLLGEIRQHIEAETEQQRRVVAELNERAARIAAELAEKNEEAARRRHAELPERLAEAIKKNQARIAESAPPSQIDQDTNLVARETRDRVEDIQEKIDVALLDDEDDGA